jgi:GTPase SAR1 family protein
MVERVERKLQAKVVVLGNMGVGKTSLLNSYRYEQSNQ